VCVGMGPEKLPDLEWKAPRGNRFMSPSGANLMPSPWSNQERIPGLFLIPASLPGHPEFVLGRVSSRSARSAHGMSLRASSRSWNASLMDLSKIKPRATCSYAHASLCPHIWSAAAPSFSSRPRLAPWPELGLLRSRFLWDGPSRHHPQSWVDPNSLIVHDAIERCRDAVAVRPRFSPRAWQA